MYGAWTTGGCRNNVATRVGQKALRPGSATRGAPFPSLGAAQGVATWRGSPHEERVGTAREKGNGLMGTRVDKVDTEHGDAIPEIRPGREVGWIFKDGDALAIERREDRPRERSARRPDPREE